MKANDIHKPSDTIHSLERQLASARDMYTVAEVVTNNFIPFNPLLARFISPDAALFLSVAYEELTYRRKNDDQVLVELSIETVKQVTGMGEKRQKKAIETLRNYHLIRIGYRGGIPRRRFVYFNTLHFKCFKTKFDKFIEEEKERAKNRKEEFEKKMAAIKEERIKKIITQSKQNAADSPQLELPF